ncbi:MAG: HAMP domain-containing histidine kinase [Thalassovita sp.]
MLSRRLDLGKRLALILVSVVVVLQGGMIWVDHLAAVDRYMNVFHTFGPRILRGKVEILSEFPEDSWPSMARHFIEPGSEVFARPVPGLHPTDVRDPALEDYALNWMQEGGVNVAEVVFARRSFDQYLESPSHGYSGQKSPIFFLGPKEMQTMRHQDRIVPPWVTGDWSAHDLSGRTDATSDPVTGPPRGAPPPPDDVPPYSYGASEYRYTSVDVFTYAARLEGAENWITIYRKPKPPVLAADITKIALSAVASVLMVGLGLLVGRRSLAPFQKLARAAERLGRGEQTPAVAEDGPKDVAAIIAAFNQMNERIGQSFEYQTGLLHSIGHDLKGPLASVQRVVPSIEDPGTRAKIEGRMQRAQTTVDAILSFSRAVLRDDELEEVDLSALVSTVVEEQADLGADAAYDGLNRLIVTCRAQATERCIHNLVENALKYAGQVQAHVFVEHNEAVVQIDDNGPGIPDSHFDDVLRPFFRLENQQEGSGLGLAIARTIAIDHGGSLRLANRSSGGLRVELRLPMSEGQPSIDHISDTG